MITMSASPPANAPALQSRVCRSAQQGISIGNNLLGNNASLDLDKNVEALRVSVTRLSSGRWIDPQEQHFSEVDDISAGSPTQGMVTTLGPGVARDMGSSEALIFDGSTASAPGAAFQAGDTYLYQFYDVPIAPTPSSSP